ncbi:MAG: glycosyltransferase family 2 protein [Bacteroidetes bacterium]|nr:glycosyltransferase family 2 protein [Bacteroidota bacterium]MBK8143573.1 glycosyltransferase family 2 protein [Bacteroidota bacterium]MBP6314068.1 glycosyltransferase family 2 protein [Chitinophagaceae bacterium]
MLPLSIIILAKNEEKNIATAIAPLVGITDDILVIDSGSTDNTKNIVRTLGATVVEMEWKGYSYTKNVASRHAKYNWILSLDADEEVNAALRDHIVQIFSEEMSMDVAYKIRRKLVIAGKVLHHGAVSNEYRVRLFNRQRAWWNQNEVHEDIEFRGNVTVKKLKGYMWHYSYNTNEEHETKLTHYAHLFAKQKIAEGAESSVVKQYLSPVFGFIKNYIFRLGFLDGMAGLQFALAEMRYTYKKYELIARYC